jgi:hypothetical protein
VYTVQLSIAFVARRHRREPQLGRGAGPTAQCETKFGDSICEKLAVLNQIIVCHIFVNPVPISFLKHCTFCSFYQPRPKCRGWSIFDTVCYVCPPFYYYFGAIAANYQNQAHCLHQQTGPLGLVLGGQRLLVCHFSQTLHVRTHSIIEHLVSGHLPNGWYEPFALYVYEVAPSPHRFGPERQGYRGSCAPALEARCRRMSSFHLNRWAGAGSISKLAQFTPYSVIMR